MFNERAQYRLHHPIRSIPDLVVATDGSPDPALAARIIAAYRRADGMENAGPVWEPLLRRQQGRLGEWLSQGDARSLAVELASLGRSEAAQGFFGGANQHRKRNGDPAFAQLLAAWTFDKLLSLAEAIGVVGVELPETGPWGETLRLSAGNLWQAIQESLGIDLSPPGHVGGYLGIEAGETVVQMRMVEAIYAAFRLRQIAEQRGVTRICEIGAGAGLTAYYAVLLGIGRYDIIDLPTMNAVQGYILANSRIGNQVALSGEPVEGRTLRILPPEAFARLAPDGVGILYNQDSLPEIERTAALAYLANAARARIPLIFSINQEAHLPNGEGGQLSVPELVGLDGSYRRTSRHRHWLREGYLEEVYELG